MVVDQGLGGRVARKREDSTPHWPDRAAAPKGAPNNVIILMDDM